jgi:anhydro-N-acetylmuramic acid kinase
VRIIGLMSGTSLDGIDAAAVEVKDGERRPDIALLAFKTSPYPSALREELRAGLPPSRGSTAGVSRLNAFLGEAFASAALSLSQENGFSMDSIDYIGSHGHTLFHDGRGSPASTLQIGSPAIIAARTGVTTIADFRSADIAAGGQGAPLVPYVDHLVLCDSVESRAAVNIGGIANITLLPAGCRIDDVRGFDIGPGNMLIDECVRLTTKAAQSYDADGAMAARGHASAALLEWLLAHPFLRLAPPKSTGREEFGAEYARSVMDRAASLRLDAADVIATVTKFSAVAIAYAVPHEFSRVIVSGGGAHNVTLMRWLAEELAATRQGIVLETSDAYGLPVDAKEAIAFALLARAAVLGIPANIPAVTGARSRVVLGAFYPGKCGMPDFSPANVVPEF